MAGYAVVDLETTGFHGAGADRILEIAIVLVDSNGNVEREWSTLINPMRDVGTIDIHGIMPRDIITAPRLRDVVPEMLELLQGRVFVAHNALFDMKFLFFRLCSLGFWVETAVPTVCTMEWSGRLLPGAARSLESSCAAAGIALSAHESALGNAQGAAALLRKYLADNDVSHFWGDALARSLTYHWPMHDRTVPPIMTTRSLASDRRSSWLDAPTAAMPRLHNVITESYLACLEQAIRCTKLSPGLARELLGLASSLGLDRTAMANHHVRYVDELTMTSALRGLLDQDHLDDLYAISRALGVDLIKVDRAIERYATPNSKHEFDLTTSRRVLSAHSQ